LSPKFGFFKRNTSDNLDDSKRNANLDSQVTNTELLEIMQNERNIIEKELFSSLEPVRNSVLECLDRLRSNADDLEQKEIKVENPQFESLINTSKKILITSIKKESLVESFEINNYEDAIKFKNNLELLINRFGQVGDSHNRILNEFMRKQLNKMKNEFDNLSSLLKEVTNKITNKQSEISKIKECTDDLVSYMEKIKEKKSTEDKLSELIEENQNLDKNIESAKVEYSNFERSGEFLKTSTTLKKIKDKKNEIATFERKMGSMISNLSRPITKFSYLASKETQDKLTVIQNEPLKSFDNSDQYLQLFTELRKHIVEKSIQIKDPEKTINQIDEISNSLSSLSSDLKNLKKQLLDLQSSVNSKSMNHLENIKGRTEVYEKHRSENITKIEESKKALNEIDISLDTLKKKIEERVLDLTNRKYSIVQAESY